MCIYMYMYIDRRQKCTLYMYIYKLYIHGLTFHTFKLNIILNSNTKGVYLKYNFSISAFSLPIHYLLCLLSVFPNQFLLFPLYLKGVFVCLFVFTPKFWSVQNTVSTWHSLPLEKWKGLRRWILDKNIFKILNVLYYKSFRVIHGILIYFPCRSETHKSSYTQLLRTIPGSSETYINVLIVQYIRKTCSNDIYYF